MYHLYLYTYTCNCWTDPCKVINPMYKYTLPQLPPTITSIINGIYIMNVTLKHNIVCLYILSCCLTNMYMYNCCKCKILLMHYNNMIYSTNLLNNVRHYYNFMVASKVKKILIAIYEMIFFCIYRGYMYDCNPLTTLHYKHVHFTPPPICTIRYVQ